ncbi:hypothetical protein ISCGN_021962, partial [Ixodes scapularis]
SLAQPPAQPGVPTPISSASSPWFRPAPTPAVSTTMTASQRQPAQALPQGMLNFCKSMVGRYLEQAYKPVGGNQIRGVIYGIDQGEDNVSLMAGLETEGSVIVAARPMSRGGNTAPITFHGTHLPRNVWNRRSVLQVYPYRARAVTCSNCHKIGHKPDICPEPQVCSTCGKPHEETMDDQGNVTCPSPIPFCQMCRKNGHLATDQYCPRRLDIVRKIREAARRRTTPPGSQDKSKCIRQDYRKKRGNGQQPAPQLTAPTTITIDPAMLLQLFTAIAAQTGTAVQSNLNPPAWQ